MITNVFKFKLLSTLVQALIYHIAFGQQVGHYTPLEFRGIQPLWASVVVDSSIIGHKIENPRELYQGFDGYSHVYYHSTIAKTPIIKDGYYYRVVRTAYDADLAGGIVEKVDLSNGHVVWKNVFDLRTNDKREFVKKAEIYNDRLVLYNIEITDKDLDIPIPIVFFFQAKGLLKIREYDLDTGDLTRIIKADSSSQYNRILTSDIVDRIQINRIDESSIEILEHVMKDINGAMLLIDTISLNGQYLNNTDTIKSEHQIHDWGDSHWSSSLKMIRDKDGLLHWIDFFIPGTNNPDTHKLRIRTFSGNIELPEINLDTLNTDDHVDNWKLLDVNDHYFLLFSANFDRSSEYFIIDRSGKLINRFSYVDNNDGYYLPAIGANGSLIKLKNGKNQQGENFIRFFQTDNESFKAISTIYTSNPKHEVWPLNLYRLDNGDFLLNVMHSDEVGIDTEGRFTTTFIINPSQIGIITSIKETENIAKTIVYPNPAYNTIRIQDLCDFDEIRIFNSQGIESGRIKNPDEEIDISHLPTGMHYCTIFDKGILVAKAKFIKVVK